MEHSHLKPQYLLIDYQKRKRGKGVLEEIKTNPMLDNRS